MNLARNSTSFTRRRRRDHLLTGGIALLALEALAIAFALRQLNRPPPRILDIAAAQRGVYEVLVDPVSGYGTASVESILCNDGRNPLVKRESGFTCDVVVDGTPRRVAVVFQDDSGTYAVDRPR